MKASREYVSYTVDVLRELSKNAASLVLGEVFESKVNSKSFDLITERVLEKASLLEVSVQLASSIVCIFTRFECSFRLTLS